MIDEKDIEIGSLAYKFMGVNQIREINNNR